VTQNWGKVRTAIDDNGRRPSLFPTVNDVPQERSTDEYGRKKSIADFTKEVYNQKKSVNINASGTVYLTTGISGRQ